MTKFQYAVDYGESQGIDKTSSRSWDLVIGISFVIRH